MFWPISFLVEKKFDRKFFGGNNFRPKTLSVKNTSGKTCSTKFFGGRKCFVWKKVRSTKIFWPNVFGAETFFGWKIFRPKIFQPKTFSAEKCFGRNNFRPKKLSAEKVFCRTKIRSKNFSAENGVGGKSFRPNSISAKKCFVHRFRKPDCRSFSVGLRYFVHIWWGVRSSLSRFYQYEFIFSHYTK